MDMLINYLTFYPRMATVFVPVSIVAAILYVQTSVLHPMMTAWPDLTGSFTARWLGTLQLETPCSGMSSPLSVQLTSIPIPDSCFTLTLLQQLPSNILQNIQGLLGHYHAHRPGPDDMDVLHGNDRMVQGETEYHGADKGQGDA